MTTEHTTEDNDDAVIGVRYRDTGIWHGDDATAIAHRLHEAQRNLDALVARKLDTYAELKLARDRLGKLERAARIYGLEFEERDEQADE